MSKITDSLPMTVIAGIVLTIIVILAAPMIADPGDPVSDAVDELKERVQGE